MSSCIATVKENLTVNFRLLNCKKLIHQEKKFIVEHYYKRNLPHYQPPEGEFFVTIRLANSLPKSVVSAVKQKYHVFCHELTQGEKSKLQQINRKYFAAFDKCLDRASRGSKWLRNDSIAKIVAEKLHSFDHQKYLLICYCSMPNHVHFLFKLPNRDESRSMKSEFPVTDILRPVEGSTARKAHKKLKREGAFWQHESYDHLVRNAKERERIIRYILLNPVKANLTKKWDDWKWTYCKEAYPPVR